MTQAKGDRRIKNGNALFALEAATAGKEDFMELMVAVCAVIAAADGRVDTTERRRVAQLMRALPAFSGFSPDAIASEFERHEQAFGSEPFVARAQLLDEIAAREHQAGDVRLLLTACQNVLEADGIHDPNEYAALHCIGQALSAA